MVLLTDAVPEAIYRELPPRLQKEVQVDRTRAPSLTANWTHFRKNNERFEPTRKEKIR